jgi:hypothetical protein
MAILGRVMMVLVMTMCAPMDLLIPYTPAHAATITTGTYISTDGTVPSGGTILDVAAMLADAETNGQTQADCTFTRPTFFGTLTIILPNTTAAWTTTNNIPLRLLIQDGATSGTTTTPTMYILVTGVLALGSSITIAGGNYTFTDQFLQLPSGITIQDGSSLTIQGGTYRLGAPSAAGGIKLVDAQNGGIHLENASTLAISNNTMIVTNVSVSGSWYEYTISSSNSPITISTSSTVSLSINSMALSNVSVGGEWQVYTISSSPFSPISGKLNHPCASQIRESDHLSQVGDTAPHIHVISHNLQHSIHNHFIHVNKDNLRNLPVYCIHPPITTHAHIGYHHSTVVNGEGTGVRYGN